MYGTVSLEMVDKLTNKPHSRDIDISNVMFDNGTCWELTKIESKQRELLESWIEERGNDQHNANLELKSWIVNIQK